MRISDWSSDVCSSDLLLVSQDLRASFAANLVHGSQTGLINAPDTKFAFVSTPDGAWSTAKHEEIGVRRASDGMAVGLRIGEHVMTITNEIGNHHYTPHWYPSIDLSTGERRILHHVLRFIEGHHPKYRSEEHTSELQSLMRISYAVFCLKKKTTTSHTPP